MFQIEELTIEYATDGDVFQVQATLFFETQPGLPRASLKYERQYQTLPAATADEWAEVLRTEFLQRLQEP